MALSWGIHPPFRVPSLIQYYLSVSRRIRPPWMRSMQHKACCSEPLYVESDHFLVPPRLLRVLVALGHLRCGLISVLLSQGETRRLLLGLQRGKC